MKRERAANNDVKSFLKLTAFGIVFALFSGSFLCLAGKMGHYVPHQQIEADYCLGVFWALVLGAGIVILPLNTAEKHMMLIAWSVKCAVTLVFMLFYESHYPLDSYGYFITSLRQSSEWKDIEIMQGGGGQVSVFLMWLQQRLLPVSYHALKVTFSMIGLFGVYIFYRSLVLFLKKEDRRLFFFFAFFPSILFWSSALGKEPVMLLGVSMYIYGFLGWLSLKRYKFLLPLAAGFILSVYMRQWFLFVMGLPLAILAFFSLKTRTQKIILICLMIIAALVLSKKIFPFRNLEGFLSLANRMSRGFDSGGSAVGDKRNFKGLWDILRFLPQGIFTTLFRPLPGQVRNAFGILAGIENTFTLFLFLAALISLVKTRLKALKEPVVIAAFVMILSWSLIYSFISYNLGSMTRYRLQILPVFLALLLYISKGCFTLDTVKNIAMVIRSLPVFSIKRKASA